MPRMPKVFVRDGYAMIETGSGDARMIDPVSDASIIAELEVRLPADRMNRLRSAMFDLPEWAEVESKSPGALTFHRMLLKNFARSGKGAQAYIRNLPGNWKVRKLGDGEWDFAVSKDGKKWHLFDPGFGASSKGMSLLDVGKETAMDLLDLTTDATIGFASGAAFTVAAGGAAPTGPGAVIAGSAAAGGTAAGLEGIKQVIGQVAGIPDNVDITDAVAMGVITTAFSGAGPAVAGGIRKVGRQIKKFPGTKVGKSVKEAILEAGAGLLGVRGGGPKLRPERILEQRIKDRAGITSQIPGIDPTAAAMRRLVQTMGRRQIPEQQIAKGMEKQAAEAGVTVNVADLIDDLLQPLVKVTKEQDEEIVRVFASKKGALKQLGAKENVSGQVQSLIDKIHEVLQLDGSDAREVPVTTVVEIKQSLQKLMRDRKAFRAAPTSSGQKGAEGVTQVDDIIAGFQGALRTQTASVLDGAGVVASDGSGRAYSQVMKDFEVKMSQLQRWKLWTGASLGDEEGIKVASQFLKGLHSTGKLGFRETAETMHASTGVDVMKHAERAMVSELFGEQGAAKIFPRISAVGEPVGAGIGKRFVGAMGGGALLGGMTGNAPGAVLGLVAGGAMASEAGHLAMQRAAPAIARNVISGTRKATNVLNQTGDARALAVVQSIARTLQRQPVEFSPNANMTPAQRDAANKLMDQISAVPGLSQTEKMDEFSRRSKTELEAP